MAAGIGSRFGGRIKQLEPIGLSGEIIIDYSIYNAIEVGFYNVVGGWGGDGGEEVGGGGGGGVGVGSGRG